MVFEARGQCHSFTKRYTVACTPVVDVKVLAGGLQTVHHLVVLDTNTQVTEDANGGGATGVVGCGLARHTSYSSKEKQHTCNTLSRLGPSIANSLVESPTENTACHTAVLNIVGHNGH